MKVLKDTSIIEFRKMAVTYQERSRVISNATKQLK